MKLQTMMIAAVLIAGCGKKAETGAGSATPSGSGSAVVAGAADAAAAPDAAAVATGPGHELAAAAATPPPAGSLVSKDPPTAESLHLEVSYALAKWAANPRDKSLYAKDFEGRDVADGRVDFVGVDDWMTKLPAQPALTKNPSIKVWLDPGTQVTLGEAKVNISYIYDDKDQYRELMWRREGKDWHLYKEQVNSQNARDDKMLTLRNWLPTDATLLGKTLTVRFGIENTFAWIVVETPSGAQVVTDIWPWAACSETEAPKDALGKLTCKDGGEGKDLILVKEADELKLRITPAGKDAPMSTDRTILLAKGAKVTLKKPAAP